MLATIQQFALDRLRQLGEEKDIRDRHLAYFLDFAEQADKQIHGPDQARWLNLLEMELNNFRTALDWCISNQKTERALRLLAALGWVWDVRCHYFEARNWFEKIRSLPDTQGYPVYYAILLNHIGRHDFWLGEICEARTLLEESQEIWLELGTPGERGLVETFLWLGWVAYTGESNKNRSQVYFEKSLQYSRKYDDKHGQALSLLSLGRINYNVELSLSLFEQSLVLFRQMGDLYWIASLLRLLGWKSRDQRDFQRAHLFHTDSLAIYEEIGFKEGRVEALLDTGILFQHEGKYDQAEKYYHQALHLSREYALRYPESLANYFLGLLSLQRNDNEGQHDISTRITD